MVSLFFLIYIKISLDSTLNWRIQSTCMSACLLIDYHAHAGNNFFLSPADDSSIDESEVFLEQTFQSEVCESADAPPLWRIGDTSLTDKTIVESYFGKVKVGHNNVTGDHQSTLILKHVNLTLNGSVVSCWANSNLILNFTLVVGEYTYT